MASTGSSAGGEPGRSGFPLAAIVPPPAGALFGEWWAGTERRRFLVQRCRSCGTAQHYPRAMCTTCGSDDVAFEVASGRASLYSFTTVSRPPHPELEAPYVVALVRLAEGPLVLTRVQGAGEGSLDCDEPLQLDWLALADGRALPVFVPDRASREPQRGRRG